MSRPATHWKDRFSHALPSRETLAAHPWLRSVAGRLLEPSLWHMQHEAVARGVAIGAFWAFVLPFGQIAVAAAHCVWWRGHIPSAAAVTLVTNPLTIGFWLWLAYQAGALVLGAPPIPAAAQDAAAVTWLTQYGAPALLGMGMFAVGGAVVGYFGVRLVWRLRVWLKRHLRNQYAAVRRA